MTRRTFTLPAGSGAALSEQERQSLTTFYRAFGETDGALLDAAVLPDWENLPAEPGQTRGPAILKPIVEQFGEAIADIDITCEQLIAEQGRAAVRVSLRGTHRGELMGVAATGKQVRLDLHELHDFAHGRIARTWHMEDMFGLFRQIGQWPD
jgi:predicted ester cyclase